MNPLLEISQVDFSYEDEKVLKDISFSIDPGKVLGLLGPNGSGKSTLVKLMSGTITPESGKILFKQKLLKNYSFRQRAQHIAVVPQEFDVAFPFTSLEVVLMGRWSYLRPFAWETEADLEIARKAMATTDCLQFAQRRVTELSGGERERVLIARALAQEPNLILLDEPTTHLDLKHQVQILRLLSHLNQDKGLTLVTVLHDLNLAFKICSKIALLKEGRLMAQGSPNQVMQEGILEEVFGVPISKEERKDGSYFFSTRF